MRKLLRGMRLPNHQWPEAMDHAVMLHNLLSSSSLPNNASPHLLWTGKQGSKKMLRVFGCMVQYRPPYARAGRFSQRAQWGLHLGIERNYNAWKIFDIHFKETVAARDVIFYERLTLPTYLANLEEDRDPTGDEAAYPADTSLPRYTKSGLQILGLVTPVHGTETPKEPATIQQALGGEHREKWHEAMDKELKALKERNTWKVVPIGVARNKTILTGKWVFRVKTKADGTIDNSTYTPDLLASDSGSYRTTKACFPTCVSQVDAVEPVEVAGDSGAGSGGAEPGGAGSGGAESGGVEPGGAEPGGDEPGGAESGGAEPGSAEPGGAEPGGAGSTRVASHGASSRRELLSQQELREWFARRWSRAAGAGVTPGAAGTRGAAAAAGVGPSGASGAAGAGAASGVGAGVCRAGGTAGAAGGTGATGPAGVGAAGASGAPGAGAAEGVSVGGSPDAGSSAGAGVGAVRAGGAAGTSGAAGGTGAVPAGSGDPARPRLYFVPLLEQVLGLPPSSGPAPSLECPQPVQSLSLLPPVSPLPAPSPYTGPTGGLAERREPASCPASPVRAARTSGRALHMGCLLFTAVT
ncbi:unnamed protein product [Closterium sp. NIES-54]